MNRFLSFFFGLLLAIAAVAPMGSVLAQTDDEQYGPVYIPPEDQPSTGDQNTISESDFDIDVCIDGVCELYGTYDYQNANYQLSQSTIVIEEKVSIEMDFYLKHSRQLEFDISFTRPGIITFHKDDSSYLTNTLTEQRLLSRSDGYELSHHEAEDGSRSYVVADTLHKLRLLNVNLDGRKTLSFSFEERDVDFQTESFSFSAGQNEFYEHELSGLIESSEERHIYKFSTQNLGSGTLFLKTPYQEYMTVQVLDADFNPHQNIVSFPQDYRTSYSFDQSPKMLRAFLPFVAGKTDFYIVLTKDEPEVNYDLLLHYLESDELVDDLHSDDLLGGDATVLGTDKRIIGDVTGEEDIDIYTFTLQEPRFVDFTFDNIPILDTYLLDENYNLVQHDRVFPPSLLTYLGENIYGIEFLYDGAGPSYELQAGTYYLIVTPDSRISTVDAVADLKGSLSNAYDLYRFQTQLRELTQDLRSLAQGSSAYLAKKDQLSLLLKSGVKGTAVSFVTSILASEIKAGAMSHIGSEYGSYILGMSNQKTTSVRRPQDLDMLSPELSPEDEALYSLYWGRIIQETDLDAQDNINADLFISRADMAIWMGRSFLRLTNSDLYNLGNCGDLPMPFQDVDLAADYCGPLNYIISKNFLPVIESNPNFYPDAALTRADAVRLLMWSFHEAFTQPSSDLCFPFYGVEKLSDNDPICLMVNILVDNNILPSDQEFRPYDPITRGEFAHLLYSIVKRFVSSNDYLTGDLEVILANNSNSENFCFSSLVEESGNTSAQCYSPLPLAYFDQDGSSNADSHSSTTTTPNDTEPDDEPTTNEIFPLPASGLEETDFAVAQTISAPSYNVNTSNQKFAFTPSVRGLHTFYSTGSVAINKVWLIDPLHNDQRIIDYDEEQSATGQNFRVGNVLEADRTYYLYVEYQAGANGTYRIEMIVPDDTSDQYGLNDDHANRLPGDTSQSGYAWFDPRTPTELPLGQTLSGSIEQEGDIDVFGVIVPDAPRSTSYTLQVNATAPVIVEQFFGCGGAVGRFEAPIGDPVTNYFDERIRTTILQPGTNLSYDFCVVVRGDWQNTADYSISFARTYPELGDDDFGDSIQKSSLVSNGWTTGVIQTDGDVDVFRYEPSTSGNVMVQLKTPGFSPGVSMTLLDASGNEIPNSFRQSDGIAVIPAITGQNIYVQVQGVVSGVTYQLTVGDEEYMSRSNMLPVNPVVVSDLGNVSGVFTKNGDGSPIKLYYQFTVAETGDYELKINQPDEAKSFLTVYDENYQMVASRESYAGYDHAVYPHLEAGKTYFVSLLWGHSINLGDLAFDFDLVKLQTALVDESDRFDQPESLQPGVEIQGIVNEWEDVDVYSFVASQDGAVNVIATVPSGASYTLYQRATGQQITSRFALRGELLVTSGSLSVKAGEEVQMVIFTDYAAEIGSKYGFRFVYSPGWGSTVPYPAQLPPDSYWPLVNYGVPKLIDLATDYSVSVAGSHSRMTGWFYVDQIQSFDVSLVSGGRFVIVDDQKNYVAHGFEGMSQMELDQGGYYVVLSSASGELENFDLRIEPTNIEPTLSFETSSLDEVFVGTPVSFNLSNSVDPDGSIVSYDWTVNGEVHPDFTGNVVSYGFDTTGDYTVEVTITDDRGAQVSESVSFTVEDRPDGDGSPALARELVSSPYGTSTHPIYGMHYYYLSYFINNSSEQLEYPGDVDFYTFVPTQTGRASIFANSSSVITLGKLYDENQNLIEVSQYKKLTDNNFFISAVLEANKRYYVSVESEDGVSTGDYLLYVQKYIDDHYSGLNMATPLTEGEAMDADISYSPNYGHDVEAFRFVPEESGDYIFGSYSNNGAIEYLLSSDQNDYNFIDGNTSSGQMKVTRTLQSGETYFLRIRIETGYSTQYARSAKAGVYVLKKKDDHSDVEIAATSLTENTSVSGQVDDAEDIDWFRVPRRYVYPGELYSVVYTGSSSAELVIGTNTVALSSGQARNINDSVGSYNTPVYVKVSGAVGSYSVEFVKESDDHGDNEAAATTMGLQTINGKIGTPGDVDVFKYTHGGYYCGYARVQILSGSNKSISWYNNRVAQTWGTTNSTYFYEYMCPGNVMHLRVQDNANGTGDYSFRVY